MNARLSRPHVRFQDSFLAAMAEFDAEGRTGDDSMVGADLEAFGSTWGGAEGFAAYLAWTLEEAERPHRPGLVRQTTWWWTHGEEYVGRISLRHGSTTGCARSAATWATTYAAAGAARATPPPCWPRSSARRRRSGSIPP